MLPLAALGFSFVGLLYGVFIAPYHLAKPSSIISASTLTGFNNYSAFLLYCLFLLPTAGTLAWIFRQWSVEPFIGNIQEPRTLPTPMVWAVLAGHLAVFSVLFLVRGSFVFGESIYFQHILARMDAGATLYRDVNFLYGSVMVYPAYWLAHAVSIPQAYGLYFVAMYLAGLYLLWLCIQAVAGGRQDADRLFLLFSVGLFNLMLGMNYIFLRHLLPMAAVFLAWSYLDRRKAGYGIGAVIVTFLALTFSTEMGGLAIVSVLCLGAIRLVTPWVSKLLIRFTGWPAAYHMVSCRAETDGLQDFLRVVGLCLVALLGFVSVFYMIDPSFHAFFESLRPVISYSAGGGNHPIYPSLPILSLLVVSVTVLALAVRSLFSQAWRPEGELILALLILSVLMQRPAFGKPDVLHIAYSGLPIFLLSLLAVPARARRIRLRTWCLGVLVIGIMLPIHVHNLFMLKPYFEKKLTGWKVSGAMAPTGSMPKASIQDSLRHAVSYFGDKQPFYLHGIRYYSLPVVLEFRLKQVPYVTSLEETFTFQEIEQVIHELRGSRAVVIALRSDLHQPTPPSFGGWEDVLYQLTASPLPGSRMFAEVVAANVALREPLREFLASSYDVVFEEGELVGLLPRRSSEQERA
jgi:hypothetical protein